MPLWDPKRGLLWGPLSEPFINSVQIGCIVKNKWNWRFEAISVKCQIISGTFRQFRVILGDLGGPDSNKKWLRFLNTCPKNLSSQKKP